MTMKMKGLLKGLRYITQIFDSEEEEEEEHEMQIGLPTDVKHLAHIGLDGPSNSSPAPSWMNEFALNSELSSGPTNTRTNSAPHATTNNSSRDMPAGQLLKPSRSTTEGSTSSNLDSTTTTQESSKKTKVKKKSKIPTGDSDVPCIPKQARKKKPKGDITNGGGSSKGSESSKTRRKADSQTSYTSTESRFKNDSQTSPDYSGAGSPFLTSPDYGGGGSPYLCSGGIGSGSKSEELGQIPGFKALKIDEMR